MVAGIVLLAALVAGAFITSTLSAKDKDYGGMLILAIGGICAFIALISLSCEVGQGTLQSEAWLDENGVYMTLSSTDLGDGSYAVMLRARDDSILAYRMQSVPPPVFIVRGHGRDRQYVPFPAPSE